MTNPIRSIAVPLVLGIVAIGLVVGTPIWALRQEQQARIALVREHTKLEGEFKAYRTQVELNNDQAKKLARDAQAQLQTDFLHAQEAKNAQITDLQHRVGLLTGELRKRPSRQDAAATGAGGAEGGEGQAQLYCTGARLPREDADFLVGESAAAETLRAELRACELKLNAVSTANDSLQSRGIFFAQ